MARSSNSNITARMFSVKKVFIIDGAGGCERETCFEKLYAKSFKTLKWPTNIYVSDDTIGLQSAAVIIYDGKELLWLSFFFSLCVYTYAAQRLGLVKKKMGWGLENKQERISSDLFYVDDDLLQAHPHTCSKRVHWFQSL